jgi:hypothetical protein
MTRLIFGVLVGLFVGASAGAWAAGVFGAGDLTGWSVTKGGEEVCTDPSVDTISKEIACD